MPLEFLCDDPRQQTSFSRFNDLPIELRLMIWGFAANIPRIVHLSKKALRTDDDPDWWRYVRSDKPVDEEDPDFYDNFDIPDFETSRINRELACQRLLTKDENYNGSMTSAEARYILHVSHGSRYGWSHTNHNPPSQLHGFRSGSIPATLLACHESFTVGTRLYSRAFASLGAFPQTYFNFHQDTLYLDSNSTIGVRSHQWNLLGVTWSLQQHLHTSDLGRVEKLAVFWNDQVIRLLGDGGFQFVDWLHNLHKCFPRLKEFTIVQDHFAYDQAVDARRDKKGYWNLNRSYQDLKYDSSRMNWDGKTRNLRIHGYLVDESIPRPSRPIQLFDEHRWYKEAASSWTKMYPDSAPWTLPKPVFRNLITEIDEARLLEDAHSFQKKYNKGRWYINPKHPYYDFEDYPFDDIAAADLEHIRLIDKPPNDFDEYAWDDLDVVDLENICTNEPKDADDLKDYMWDDFDPADFANIP
jgi:hypothetical protein